MDEKTSISNIPLIFSQYRLKVLEESGRKWFHPDNDPAFLPISPVETPEASPASSEGTALEVMNGHAEVAVATASPSVNSATLYDHPDPWETEPLDPGIFSQVTPEVMPSNPEEVPALDPDRIDPDLVDEGSPSAAASELAVEPSVASSATMLTDTELPDTELPDTDPEVQSPASVEDPERVHPSTNVNLFPFDSGLEDEAHDARYDLTEFANGEMEVPPVAVRDVQSSKFEKVNQTSNNVETAASPDEAESDKPSKSNRNQRPKPASAEIAKYRLRNCL